MEWILTKKGGQEVAAAAQVRICTKQDLPELYALQQRVIAAMPDKELFVPNSEEEMARNVAYHLTIAVWAEGKAIALGILRYPGESGENYASHLGVPESMWKYWANADTVIVDPLWRGNRLQQKLVELFVQWRRPEIVAMGCTVSPKNRFSLDNVLACGFTVRDRKIMYGCHDRYLLSRDLAPLPGRYRHFKGGEYRVLYTAYHSETREPMVVYQALYGRREIWVRPVHMWSEYVQREDYSGPRFIYIGE